MKLLRPVLLLALLAVAALFPVLFPNPAVDTVAVLTLMFAAMVTAWNAFSGYSGYISIGHAAYFGIGSYALAILCQDWHVAGGYLPFLLVPLAGLIAVVFAIPMGWVALRTRRHTFVILTIAMFFIMQLMAYNLRSVTNGSRGMSLPIPVDWSGAFYDVPFYYVGLALLLVALGVSWWIRNSKYGLGLLAIRDDEDRARGLGVRTGPFKLTAFVIAAFFFGMVGGLHAYFVESIFPPFAFDPLIDLMVALMAFLGGLGTLAGPVLGAVILVPAQQVFTIWFAKPGFYLMIYGALFLAIILLLPQGIVPALRNRFRKSEALAGPPRRGDAGDELAGAALGGDGDAGGAA
ncbi:MAG: branched-chain amino acid ABC transporter permease [Deinococcales bacterium]